MKSVRISKLQTIALTSFLVLFFVIGSTKVVAQTYSKTFVIKGKDGGKFRVKAYLRQSQGTKQSTIKVSSTIDKSKLAATTDKTAASK